MAVDGVGSNSGASAQASSGDPTNPLPGLELQDFLDLMIAELQNQDPLDPKDNDQMLQQISELRSIAASDQLRSTLESVALNQSVSSGANLIGKQVTGLTDGSNPQDITGIVERVSIVDGATKVFVDGQGIAITNIRHIQPVGAEPVEEPSEGDSTEDEAESTESS